LAHLFALYSRIYHALLLNFTISQIDINAMDRSFHAVQLVLVQHI